MAYGSILLAGTLAALLAVPGAGPASLPAPGPMRLHSAWLEAAHAPASRGAQTTAGTAATRDAPSATTGETPSTATDATAASAATDAPAATDATDATDAAAPTTTPDPASASTVEPAGDDEPDIELLRTRARLTRIHRTLGITTLVSLAVTTTLGTLLAVNQPTLFGSGQCSNASGLDVFGAFGCGPLTYVHEVSAFVTVGLYTATGIFALAMPDPEHAAAGHDARGSRLRLHRAMAWVHFVGMVLEPLLGIVSVAPGILGVSPSAAGEFSTVMRTVHLGVGYVTLAALSTAMALEF